MTLYILQKSLFTEIMITFQSKSNHIKFLKCSYKLVSVYAIIYGNASIPNDFLLFPKDYTKNRLNFALFLTISTKSTALFYFYQLFSQSYYLTKFTLWWIRSQKANKTIAALAILLAIIFLSTNRVTANKANKLT